MLQLKLKEREENHGSIRQTEEDKRRTRIVQLSKQGIKDYGMSQKDSLVTVTF